MKRRLFGVFLFFLAAMAHAVALAAQSGGTNSSDNASAADKDRFTVPISIAPLTGRAGTNLELIHESDKIGIEVYHEEDLSGTFVVDSSGKINYPLLGQIYAKGLSLEELRAYLVEKLSADYIVNPQIQIVFLESPNKSIAILGQVARPGNYILIAKSTLVRMISQIGGFLPEASTSNVSIVRTDPQGKKAANVVNVSKIMAGEAEDFALEPGDLVFVDRLSPEEKKKEEEPKEIVTVMGQVNRPGNYELTPGFTLVRAIAQAGGFTQVASVSNVRIIRRSNDGREKVSVVNAGRVMAGQMPDIPLEPGDLIVVAESFF